MQLKYKKNLLQPFYIINKKIIGTAKGKKLEEFY